MKNGRLLEKYLEEHRIRIRKDDKGWKERMEGKGIKGGGMVGERGIASGKGE